MTNNKTVPSNKLAIKSVAVPIIKEIQKEEAKVSQWIGSPYGAIRDFQIDTRGAVGETLIASLLTGLGRKVSHNEATTDDEKDWDLICDDLKYEIKTATLGRDGVTFQHEGIDKTRHYDGLIFVDIAPNDIYISIYAKKKIAWNDLHRRKDSSFYKWDTHLRPTRKHDIGDNIVKTVADFDVLFRNAESEILKLNAKKKPINKL